MSAVMCLYVPNLSGELFDYLAVSKEDSKRYKRDLRKLKDLYGYAVQDNELHGDRVLYRQGWFMNKTFFNRKTPCYFGTTKKEMERILLKYLDFRKEAAVEAYRAFMSNYKDGMLFELAW